MLPYIANESNMEELNSHWANYNCLRVVQKLFLLWNTNIARQELIRVCSQTEHAPTHSSRSRYRFAHKVLIPIFKRVVIEGHKCGLECVYRLIPVTLCSYQLIKKIITLNISISLFFFLIFCRSCIHITKLQPADLCLSRCA